MKKKQKAGYNQPQRLHFASDEALFPWLPMLLDAYYIIDKGIAEALRTENRKGRKAACSKGCSFCCRTHNTIPVYPLELVGLSWYVTEKTAGRLRETIKTRLIQYREGDPCPFLVGNDCAIHPMRPAACRQFIVFDTPCSEGEDPYYSRRQDVLSPLRKYVDKAFFIMLPFYGVEEETERLKMIETGAVHGVVRLIQACIWRSLADKMVEFDKNVRVD